MAPELGPHAGPQSGAKKRPNALWAFRPLGPFFALQDGPYFGVPVVRCFAFVSGLDDGPWGTSLDSKVSAEGSCGSWPAKVCKGPLTDAVSWAGFPARSSRGWHREKAISHSFSSGRAPAHC